MFVYHLPNCPKMLQETLSLAQHLVIHSDDIRKREHAQRIQDVINECSRMRPTGTDGKHGDLHTDQCGCADPETEPERRERWHNLYGKKCPTCQGITRETTNMVCETCGRDYMLAHPYPTKSF